MPKKKPIYFEDVADRSLRLIDGTLDDLERLRRQNRKQQRENDDFELDLLGLTALEKTTKALSGLLSQLRQIAKDNRDKMGNIGPSERLRMILDYFATLPEEHMYSLLMDCKAIYDDRRGRKDARPPSPIEGEQTH